MIRKIIKIDENKCNGCGACAKACHEGAIGMVDGVAKLLRDDYCDGLGDCLPACPKGAITFEVREAAAYDEEAVKASQKRAEDVLACVCAGSHSKALSHHSDAVDKDCPTAKVESQLMQWPVQIKLVPVNAPYFDNADLLIAADCCAFAYGSFHDDFIKDHITIVGCPKLDDEDYSGKLEQIIQNNNIKSITVTRMEVPCCGGMEMAAKKALDRTGKEIPIHIVTIGTEGNIL